MHLVILAHLPSFGWYVIPAWHFSQNILSGNSKIGFPFLSTTRLYPLLPLTHGPPPLYWLGTSGWCLSFLCAPFPCVFVACLLFMRLPWPECLSARSASYSWPLVVWMSFWTFILYVLLLSWAGSCSVVGLSFFNPTLNLFAGCLTLFFTACRDEFLLFFPLTTFVLV